MIQESLTQEYLKTILRYEPETGYLFWKVRRQGHAIGSIAGSVNKNGYIYIGIDQKKYCAHRIIWVIVNGKFPPEDIDHINKIRDDNRIKNLRLASRTENLRNTIKQPLNTSGITGVAWCNHYSKWRSSITVAYRFLHLGYFDNLLDAVSARRSAEIKHGFFPGHGL